MKEMNEINTNITPEFETQILDAYGIMESKQVSAQIFGSGFILVRADAPDLEAYKAKGEVLNSINIHNVDFLVISPGVNE